MAIEPERYPCLGERVLRKKAGPVMSDLAAAPRPQDDNDAGSAPGRDTVREPAKVIRLGRMAVELLDEVRSAPLDEAGRLRLLQIHDKSVRELEETLSPSLSAELNRLAASSAHEPPSSDAELRVAQAQLVGWLEGVVHEMEAALVVDHLQARLSKKQTPNEQSGSETPASPVNDRSGNAYL